jgi:hypothetical protein
VHCRSDILVEDKYQHGDHIKCGACSTKHKVIRGESSTKLVIADTGPLKEALRHNEALIARLEDELRGARHSLGIGANGVGVAVAYFMYQVFIEDQLISTDLAIKSAVVGVVAGILLEVANFLFLAKRQAMIRLNAELDEARSDGKELARKIREASRV